MDKEVLREIWHGQLPLCFKLHPDDVCGMHRPDPYYMMVPRVTYFPLILDRVVKYFNRFMDQNKQNTNDMWLDYDGQPIKWHHPIGLSWDLLGSSHDLPWRLILHFSDFPSKELLRCNTKPSIETNFISNIKEADALKHKGAVMKSMLKKDQNQLWSSLLNDRFDQFWSINKKLMERADDEFFRYIPFRLYLPDYSYIQKIIRPCTIDEQIFEVIQEPESGNFTKAQSPLSYDYDSNIVINRSHKCTHTTNSEDKNEEKTLAHHRCSTMLDLIRVSFSNRMNDLLIPINEDGQEPKRDPKTDKSDIDVRLFKYRFISHGVEIPFDTPLQWLSENFSYPDNFLHICAVLKETPEYL